jgi:hypothetical protein
MKDFSLNNKTLLPSQIESGNQTDLHSNLPYVDVRVNNTP